MTDRIDLDDLEAGGDDEDEAGSRGDWLWRDDESAEPPEEPVSSQTTAAGGDTADAETATTTGNDETDADGSDRAPAPHVPKTGESTPVGIPTAGDGADTGTSSGDANSTAGTSGGGTESMRPMGADPSTGSDAANGTETASGPHGGGADDMTMALTSGALRRLEHPAAVFASAYEWSDWVGIVGDVPAHVVQKFQRDHGIDVDFFNGSGTGPGERLAEIDRNSMFYADRMVVVGRAGEDEAVAERADWEFVPLETAAEKADWKLADGDA